MSTEPASFSNASAPRYQQLTDTLIHEIRSGQYPVGSLLPPEPRLIERFGVSRHTVREAVRRLAEMGLVARRQGVGTVVRARDRDTRYLASLSSLEELMQYTQQTRLKRLGERWVEADEALAALLRCKPGQRWLEFDTCRYPASGSEPFVHMVVYVHAAYESIRHHLDEGSVWFYGLIEKHYGEAIVEVQQETCAIAMSAHSARLLGVKPRSPGLQVVRYYLGRDDRMLSVSVNVYPAERFKVATRWRLERHESPAAEPSAPPSPSD